MRFKDTIARFMYGRYGVDKLCYALVVLSLILTGVNSFVRTYTLQILAMLLMVYILFRVFSRNIGKRQAENAKFEGMWRKVKPSFIRFGKRIKEIKTYRYRTCPNCKAILHLPRKTGKHTVVCPCCKKEFDVKILF